jgi:hypothetical protein
MAIRMTEIAEPIIVHKLPAVDKKIGRVDKKIGRVDKKLGRPRLHPDRAIYKRDFMRKLRVQDRVDAMLLAQMD